MYDNERGSRCPSCGCGSSRPICDREEPIRIIVPVRAINAIEESVRRPSPCRPACGSHCSSGPRVW